MKKIISLLLCLAMLFAIVGCSAETVGTDPNSEKNPANENNTQGETNDNHENDEDNEDDDVRHKIGMIWYGNTDAMGGTFYAWANHAAELLNVELVWALGSFTCADELKDAENLISAGCEGIYFVPMDTAANLQLGNYCMENNVWFATSNRDIMDDEVLTAMEANPYFVTRVFDDSYNVCFDMVEVLAGLGIKKVCMIDGDPTNAMMVDRNNGFIDGAKEYGVEILGTFQNSSDMQVIVDGVSNFLTLYPEMEGILAVSGTNGVGEAIMSTLNGSGREKGSIKVSEFDTFSGNQEAFDDGWLACSCGGYTTECLIALLALVNQVKGNDINQGQVIPMKLRPLLITSSEDMEIFSTYVDNPEIQLYSDEIILSLVGPDVTAEDYQAVLDGWSIDFIKEAVGIE